MSFQAYLDNIKDKTGKPPDDFKLIAEKKGLLKDLKAGDIVKWLKEDFEMGHGHAMAIYASLKSMKEPKSSGDEQIAQHFTGAKEIWRKPFDSLVAKLKKLGTDVSIAPTSTYLSVVRGDKKFAVVQVAGERMDIGIKLKDAPGDERLEPSGTWNSMVTHRVRITNAKQIDKELLGWLQNAYEQALKKK